MACLTDERKPASELAKARSFDYTTDCLQVAYNVHSDNAENIISVVLGGWQGMSMRERRIMNHHNVCNVVLMVFTIDVIITLRSV